MSDSAPSPPAPRAERVVLRLFAGIGLLAALMVIYLGFARFSMSNRNRQEPAPVEAKAASQALAVAEVKALDGTNFQEIVIATEASIDRGGGSYSPGGPRDERNVILLDKASGANRKLLPDNNRHIVSRDYFPALAGPSDERDDGDAYVVKDAAGEKQKPPLAYYVVQVRADLQSVDILVGEIASGRQAFVLTGIDGVDRIWMQGPTRVALLMRRGRKLQYRAIDIPTLKVVAAQPVEID